MRGVEPRGFWGLGDVIAASDNLWISAVRNTAICEHRPSVSVRIGIVIAEAADGV